MAGSSISLLLVQSLGHHYPAIRLAVAEHDPFAIDHGFKKDSRPGKQSRKTRARLLVCTPCSAFDAFVKAMAQRAFWRYSEAKATPL
jgi:hypothetical protein